MPNYSDGQPAQVGDIIKGKPYNTPHVVVGEVIGVTEGSEICNLRVAFVVTKPGEIASGVAAQVDYNFAVWRGTDGKLVSFKIDYGETRAFILLHRPPVPEAAVPDPAKAA